MQIVLTAILDETALAGLAARLAQLVQQGDCIALEGVLGAGKTTFARALIRAFLDDPAHEVPSPTFPLRQDYAGPLGGVVHFDLYRIVDPRELDEIGLEEALGTAVALVEWPQRAGSMLPECRIIVRLEAVADPDRRRVTVAAASALVARLGAITLSG